MRQNLFSFAPMICLGLVLSLYSCKSQRSTTYGNELSEGIGKAGENYNRDTAPTGEVEEAPSKKSKKLSKVEKQKHAAVEEAESFLGVPYKYGGTTRRGMDCSGLIYTSYKTVGRTLPRISYQMAEAGTKIKLKEVEVGDLVCFSAKGRGRIDHVGLVTSTKGGKISFIHSTTSRGVMINTTTDPYWKDRFVKAVRL